MYRGIKPERNQNVKIMKKYIKSLFITLLIFATYVISPINVMAQWHIEFYTPEADRVLHLGGNTIRGNFASESEANAYWNSQPKFEKDNSRVVGPDHTNNGSSKTSVSSQNPEVQLVQTLIESLFDAAFKKPGNSQKQMSDPNEQAEARQKKEALQRWLDFKATEAMKKEAEKTKQGEDLHSQMQTIGNEGALQPFSTGNPKLDIQPLNQNPYPTSNYTEWERLLCSAYFSDLAKKSANDVDSRFYADQAERVMAGEPTFIECKIPKVSDEKAKKLEEVKILYNEMNMKANDLQDIERNLIEVRDTLDKAANKKAEATKKLAEMQNNAATAKVEEKSKLNDLVLQAQKELEEAEKEFNLATQAEKDLLVKKENSEIELSNLRNQIQGKIQSGEEK
jgi:hypothetical protein